MSLPPWSGSLEALAVFTRTVGFLARYANASMIWSPLCVGATGTRKAPAPGTAASRQTKATLAWVTTPNLANSCFSSFMRQEPTVSFLDRNAKSLCHMRAGWMRDAHDARRHRAAGWHCNWPAKRPTSHTRSFSAHYVISLDNSGHAHSRIAVFDARLDAQDFP